ncbi:MAG: DUF3137 domain-containing protein [Oscillospiraceae bacterium]
MQQHNAGPNPKNQSWQETNYVRQERSKKERKGCFGCFGYILAFVSVVLLNTAAYSVLGQRGFVSGGVDLSKQFIQEYGLAPIAPYLGIMAMASLIIGILIALYSTIRDMSALDKRYQASYQNGKSEYDIAQAERWKKHKKSTKRFWIFGLLLLVPALLSFPLSQIIPLLPPANSGIDPELFAKNITLFTVGSAQGLGIIGIVLLFIPLLKAIKLFTNTGVPVSPHEMIKSVLDKVFKNAVFVRESGIPKDIIDNTNLMPWGNSFSSNDYIQGEYRGFAFAQSDVKYSMIEHFKDDNSSKTTDIFSGRWLSVTNTKTITGSVYLYNRRFDSIGKKIVDNPALQNVQTEDMEFNSLFTIYAQNPQEAFYLLTPRLMERLKEFVTTTEDKPMREGIGICCFQNQIHFALSGVPDAFQFLYVGALTEDEVRSRIIKDILPVTDMMDALASSALPG